MLLGLNSNLVLEHSNLVVLGLNSNLVVDSNLKEPPVRILLL